MNKNTADIQRFINLGMRVMDQRAWHARSEENKTTMTNKNHFPKDGYVRVLTISYDQDYEWSHVILSINHIKDIFYKCMILLQNCEINIFTSISQTVLFNLSKDSVRKCSRLIVDFDQLCSLKGFTHPYLIYWNNENECRVIPKCLDSANVFEYVLLEKEACLPPYINVPLESLLRTGVGDSLKQHFDVCINEYTVNYRSGTLHPPDYAAVRQQANIQDNKKNTYTVSLKDSRKVIPARDECTYSVYPVNGEFPFQVSNTQDSVGDNRVTIAFDNGSSYSVPVDSQGLSRHEREDYVSPLLTDYNGEQSNVSIGERPRRPQRYPQYSDFVDRYTSFGHWTLRNPNPLQLSEAGFFYTNEGDTVRCFQCGIGLKDFTEDDDPLLEHVRHSGDCEYLFDHLGPSRLAEIRSRLRLPDQEETRRRQLQQQAISVPEINYACRHPDLNTIEARLRTFARWPTSIMQTPRQLAEAGFYYTGIEDHVRCFACDGGLRRWDPEDNPWMEHCRWFPACSFARQHKGDEYIALVQASANHEHDDNSAAAGGIDMTQTMAQMTLRDPQFRATMNEHKQACLEMGFKEDDFNDTVEELKKRGTIRPTLEEIIDNIEIVRENREAAKRLQFSINESPEEENKRLKRIFLCMKCEKNNVNVLFLPCTHHKLCMECSAPLSKCPVCDRTIKEKIKTFMA